MKWKTTMISAITAVLTISSAVFSVSAAGTDVVVFDNDYAWTDSTVINLFERNELDNQLVYPGVTGNYTFTVRNISDAQKECEVIIEDENSFFIPLDVRIKRDGKYIIGSENEWANSAAFDSSTYLLDPKSDNVYELEWKWDFYNSESDDQRDTKLGVNAHYETEPYNVKIKVLAETEPEPSEPSEPSESSEPSEPSEPSNPESSTPEPSVPESSAPSDTPTTGDNRNLWILIPLGAVSLGTALMLSKKKNQSPLSKE